MQDGDAPGSGRGLPKRAAQTVALAAVAALLALLIWQVATRDAGGAAAELEKSGTVLAPDFTLPRIDGIPGAEEGGPITLSSLRGKVVVLNFWASWCIPCKQESPRLQEIYMKHRDRGVVVLGVDAQDFKGDARDFAKKYRLTYPLVHDGKGTTLGPYGVTGFPETYFLDRNGNIVGQRVQGEISTKELEEGIELALAAA